MARMRKYNRGLLNQTPTYVKYMHSVYDTIT